MSKQSSEILLTNTASENSPLENGSQQGKFWRSCRSCFLSLAIACLIPIASIGLFIWFWHRNDPPRKFEVHEKERNAVVALIQSGELPLIDTRTSQLEDGAIYTSGRVELPENYRAITRKGYAQVAREGNVLEVAFLLDTWQFGDGQLYFVYRSDKTLENQAKLTAKDFLLFSGANYFEAEALAPHWYRVAEEW